MVNAAGVADATAEAADAVYGANALLPLSWPGRDPTARGSST